MRAEAKEKLKGVWGFFSSKSDEKKKKKDPVIFTLEGGYL